MVTSQPADANSATQQGGVPEPPAGALRRCVRLLLGKQSLGEQEDHGSPAYAVTDIEPWYGAQKTGARKHNTADQGSDYAHLLIPAQEAAELRSDHARSHT